jgi:hypothetical protein
MKLALLAFILLLAGCGATAPNVVGYKVIDYNVMSEPGTRSTTVRWITVADIDSTCRSLGATAATRILACARWTRNHQLCEIYTGPSTSHQALGHELHHCFDGQFHDWPTLVPIRLANIPYGAIIIRLQQWIIIMRVLLTLAALVVVGCSTAPRTVDTGACRVQLTREECTILEDYSQQPCDLFVLSAVSEDTCNLE